MRRELSCGHEFDTNELIDEIISRGDYEVDNEGQIIIYTGVYES